jgi:DNA (cytosine-5)-methyltransferase 1
MTHGSLFSGIGGFDLASEWMGWDNKFHCEWNEFGQKVLHHYWPQAELFTDITKSNFTKYANKIDILTGGFPCQPYSSAGKRLGKEDSRHLWPEMLRAIREIQPSWVVGENVRGLTNWNGGLVFDEVQSDLEAQGYEILPFLLPACAINAPHRRDRIWFVAYSNNARTNNTSRINREWQKKNKGWERQPQSEYRENGSNEYATNTNSNGLNECNSEHEVNTSEGGEYAQRDSQSSNDNGDASDTNSSNCQTWSQREILGQQNRKATNGHSNVECRNKWENFPTVSPVCDGDDGLSDRLDNITFPKWRNESIKAGGNAIVPQVVYQIYKAIEQYELILQNA